MFFSSKKTRKPNWTVHIDILKENNNGSNTQVWERVLGKYGQYNNLQVIIPPCKNTVSEETTGDDTKLRDINSDTNKMKEVNIEGDKMQDVNIESEKTRDVNTNNTIESVTQNIQNTCQKQICYSIEVHISEQQREEFFIKYIKNKRTYIILDNNYNNDHDNIQYIYPPGIQVLTVYKKTYQMLGLNEKYKIKRNKNIIDKERYDIEIPQYENGFFKDNSLLRKRILWVLSKDRIIDKYTIIIIYDKELIDNEIVLPNEWKPKRQYPKNNITKEYISNEIVPYKCVTLFPGIKILNLEYIIKDIITNNTNSDINIELLLWWLNIVNGSCYNTLQYIAYCNKYITEINYNRGLTMTIPNFIKNLLIKYTKYFEVSPYTEDNKDIIQWYTNCIIQSYNFKLPYGVLYNTSVYQSKDIINSTNGIETYNLKYIVDKYGIDIYKIYNTILCTMNYEQYCTYDTIIELVKNQYTMWKREEQNIPWISICINGNTKVPIFSRSIQNISSSGIGVCCEGDYYVILLLHFCMGYIVIFDTCDISSS